MKDLFKGHHPWLLVLVIAVDIFSALVIRHSILSARKILSSIRSAFESCVVPHRKTEA